MLSYQLFKLICGMTIIEMKRSLERFYFYWPNSIALLPRTRVASLQALSPFSINYSYVSPIRKFRKLRNKISHIFFSFFFPASKRLSDLIRQPYDLYRAGVLDEYFMGLMNQVAQAMDDSVTQEVPNQLFN